MTINTDFFNRAQTLIPAEVRMISGCDDEQTSADVSHVSSSFRLPDPAGRAGGACTSALLEILYSSLQHREQLSFVDVLMRVRNKLAVDGFSQIPQLTSSRPLDVQETPFHLVGGNGARRAVLVGINYIGQDGQLSGCHNDVQNMKEYLMKVHGFPERDIVVLLDDGVHHYPTRNNMMTALERMVSESVAGDSVFVHYSGHGGLLPDDYGAKGFKETLIPVDHQATGHIRDLALFNHFVQPMAAGVTVTCVMDCCHSGSVLDLPYTFKANGEMDNMVENIAYLSNLALLFTIAGGVLPAGFGDIFEEGWNHLGNEGQIVDGAAVEDVENEAHVVEGAAVEDGENEAQVVEGTAVEDGDNWAQVVEGTAVEDGEVEDAPQYGTRGFFDGGNDNEDGENAEDTCGVFQGLLDCLNDIGDDEE